MVVNLRGAGRFRPSSDVAHVGAMLHAVAEALIWAVQHIYTSVDGVESEESELGP